MFWLPSDSLAEIIDAKEECFRSDRTTFNFSYPMGKGDMSHCDILGSEMNIKILAAITCLMAVVGAYLLTPTCLGLAPQDFIRLSVELLNREGTSRATFLVTISNGSPWPIRFQGVKEKVLANSIIPVELLGRVFPDKFILAPFAYNTYFLYVGLPSIDQIKLTISGEVCILVSPWRVFILEASW